MGSGPVCVDAGSSSYSTGNWADVYLPNADPAKPAAGTVFPCAGD